MIFKNSKIYDCLKWICLVFLSALACLYGTLADIWSLPYGPEVTATINAVNAFLGALIGISGARFQKSKENKDE